MKNLKIGKKLFVTFGIMITLFCVTVLMSIFSLVTIGGNFTVFYEGPYPVTNQASDLRTSIQAVGKNIGYATMSDDKQKTAEYVQAAQDELQSLRDGIAFIKENFLGDQSLIVQFDQTMDSMVTERDLVMDYALNNRNKEATKLYFDKVMPALIEATNLLSQINDAAMVNAQNEYESAMNRSVVVMIFLLGLSALVLLVTISLAVYITRSLVRPIKELDMVANEIAEGTLQVSVQYTSRDELGSLADSMRRMTERISFYMGEFTDIMQQLAAGNLDIKKREAFLGDFRPVQDATESLIEALNDTLGHINQSADQVASGSNQVSSGAQALSQGATEQASSVEELAATINEISVQVQRNAAGAKDASQKADEVGKEMQVSNDRMRQMIRAMGEISGSSSEIGKIIKTIEDIAFQTNILALNAAVEAARAGAAGKGFAVVADEVRNLASKSSEASKNTAALIESSIRAVENGTHIADATAESLTIAVTKASEVVKVIDQISGASVEQANSIAQVTQGVDQISSVVQTNSATAEESAAASEELSSQAQVLKSLVARFKLKGTAGGAMSEEKQPLSLQESTSRKLVGASKY